MDLEFYNKEAIHILSDKDTYTPWNKDPTIDFQAALTTLLKNGLELGILSQKEYDFINIPHPVIPVFYFLPKLHKNNKFPPGRPIISGIQSLTSNLSQYIDHFLQKYVILQQSHLKDTTSILKLLPTILWADDMWLVTSDVTALYTAIDHTQGTDSIKHYLSLDTDLDPLQTDFITKGIMHILQHNYFWFNDQFYVQRQGTAMGTRFAPSYANLFMSRWEDLHIWGREQVGSNLVLWRRYIDDIIFIWKGSEDTLLNFISSLNNNNLNLNFTTTYSKDKIEFLDLEIFISNNTICTRTFHKKVDVNSFILSSSNHHPSWLANIPGGQFRRIRRNCTDIDQYRSQGLDLKTKFQEKGYSPTLINKAFTAAEDMDRNSLLQYNDKVQPNTQDNKVLFITQYNDKSHQLQRILRKHWHILQQDETLKPFLGNKPEVVFRRAPNIKQKLVRNHIRDPIPRSWLNSNIGFYHCGNCIGCKSLNYHHNKPDTTFLSNTTKKEYKISSAITCNSNYVTYLLECPCGQQYVGRTIRTLRERIGEHLRNIKKGFEAHSLSEHFKTHHNQDTNGLKFKAIEHTPKNWRGGDRLKQLNTTELKWIFTLKTAQPDGLNIDTDLLPILG